jgi:hypothetical protein
VSAIRRQLGFDKSSSKPTKIKPVEISPSATEDVEELSDDIFTQQINLKNGKVFLLYSKIKKAIN